MDIWLIALLVVHVIAALAIIGLVLLQHGKGADMGAAFGSGASGSLFGATGSANFLSRTTAIFAAIFFMTSLGLAYQATHRPAVGGGVMESVKELPSVPVPSEPARPEASKATAAGADSAADKGSTGRSKADEVPK
ncbi:MAG: preprotein translocase subunit SecG [Betaproteobacteria bacterium RIFCSPLOWO2_12_FULL_63_13]|nr:MAG: preprotein translocase subunit SecG [Betaproteobacteria bacterium RIFCSPLOWO2_02_FULL_63_19]OGA50801.1 MAG: preprotein translocase subunit SecG [Betaproteobacteria bacterium RIFCSPLOWO2_12_FULL_63_13]